METIPDYYINIQIAILNTKIYICMEGGGIILSEKLWFLMLQCYCKDLQLISSLFNKLN